MARKPWEIPTEYNDDRFDDDPPARHAPPVDPAEWEPGGSDGDGEVFGIDEGDEPRFSSLDDEPMDYSRGPHDREFGVDDDDF